MDDAARWTQAADPRCPQRRQQCRAGTKSKRSGPCWQRKSKPTGPRVQRARTRPLPRPRLHETRRTPAAGPGAHRAALPSPRGLHLLAWFQPVAARSARARRPGAVGGRRWQPSASFAASGQRLAPSLRAAVNRASLARSSEAPWRRAPWRIIVSCAPTTVNVTWEHKGWRVWLDGLISPEEMIA